MMPENWRESLKSSVLCILATGIVSAPAFPANALSCMDEQTPGDDAQQALVNQARQSLETNFGVFGDALGGPVSIGITSATFPVTEAAAKQINDQVMEDGQRTDDEPLIRYFRTCTGQIGDEVTSYGVTSYVPDQELPENQSKALPKKGSEKAPRPRGP